MKTAFSMPPPSELTPPFRRAIHWFWEAPELTRSRSASVRRRARSNILTIARGAGHPVSDSWETYSSRRWKTNIQTLPDALSKVERLRGVSYDRKDNGKHEIGVIAEEVGVVVPEVVSYEANGKDASGVDYSRLTALLIEATKAQQRELAIALRQIKHEQRQLRLGELTIRGLQLTPRRSRELAPGGSKTAPTRPTLSAHK